MVLIMITLEVITPEVVLIITTLEVKQLLKLAQADKDAQGVWSRLSYPSESSYRLFAYTLVQVKDLGLWSLVT